MLADLEPTLPRTLAEPEPPSRLAGAQASGLRAGGGGALYLVPREGHAGAGSPRFDRAGP